MRKTFLLLSVLMAGSMWAQQQYTSFTSSESGRPRKGILLDNGKELIAAQFKYIFHTNSHFFVYDDSLWGWYDQVGQQVVAPSYEDVGYGMVDSLLRVKKDGRWGYIDIYNRTKIPFQYEFACNFEDGKAYVLLDGEKGYIDQSGKLLAVKPRVTYSEYCPEDTDVAEELPDGFQLNPDREKVQIDGLFGVIDSSGNTIIPAKYDQIGTYFNGVIEVEKDGKYGAYKEDGTLICEPKYEGLNLFNPL